MNLACSMATPYTKGEGTWHLDIDPDDPCIKKHTRRSVMYYRALFQAWPDWCANDPEFACIYKYAETLRACGYDAHVDHIVPIKSNIVCGLHVPWNLTVIFSGHNLTKSNHIWPDHPFENGDLFE